MSKDFLNIKAVSNLTGISTHTLRAWEKRYNTISPARTDTGRRVYSMSDVDRLRLIARLVEVGYSISGIAALSLAELQKLTSGLPVSGLPSHSQMNLTSSSVVLADARTIKTQIISDLGKIDLDGIARTLARATMNLPARALVFDVISPLLEAVGDRVAAGSFSIAEEHALSAILRDHLGRLLHSARGAVQVSPHKVLLATREGDLHEFGILMSAIICALCGYYVYYLGPNVPAVEVAKMAARADVSIVIIGTTVLPEGVSSESVRKFLETLRGSLDNKVQLWVGGPGISVGDDFFQTARSKKVESLQALEALLSNQL